MATTRLISPLGKLRMGLDLVLPPRRACEDETVAGFIERRLGGEAYRWLVDPLVRGIYAADGRCLSLAATFPQWRRLEEEHGGLIRGTLVAQRMAASSSGSPFQAPRGGLGELVDALTGALRAADVRLETGCAVEMPADAVICATPAHAAVDLLAGLDPALAGAMRAIPHASVASVALGYATRDVPRPLNGSGYVTPRAEGRLANACTWVSAKWAERAPEDAVLLRASFGGAGQEEIVAASDDRLLAMARDELRDVLGITAAPRLARLFRWPRAMPQYELGHGERVATIEACLDRHPGLEVAGNAYRGVGLADCAQSGEQAAARVATFLAERVASVTE
jgi:oxygen-dependent protoporphyrinogen oxidase